MAIRDNAFNTANAHGLEAYITGNILREDTNMIDHMNARNQQIADFGTLMDENTTSECTEKTVTLSTHLSASAYTLCENNQCQEMPASKETHHVKLIFSLPQLLLTDVQPVNDAS